ncbi:MAG: hypothetical protein H0X17_11310 [Deltaproteobacteria bacterium]|nr:hypothetical protein [Deltaproteobacteria bacterium]
MTEPANPNITGLVIDYLEWKTELRPGVSVELIEVAGGKIDLSALYVKPGTALELDEIEFLEAKIAL